MVEIPVVDFAKAADGTREEKEQVAKSIDYAFRNVGFVYLKNHGVPLEMVDECFDWVSHHLSRAIPPYTIMNPSNTLLVQKVLRPPPPDENACSPPSRWFTPSRLLRARR
jgi:hypothetical protein